MPAEDETLAEQPPRLTHVIYNAALGHVRVRTEDGLATTVEVPPGEVRFRRVLGAEEPEAALWLDSIEWEYLGRMLEHVLAHLKITPEARAALEAVRAKLTALAPPPIVAGEENTATSGPPEPALLEPTGVAPPAVSLPQAGPPAESSAAARAAPPRSPAEELGPCEPTPRRAPARRAHRPARRQAPVAEPPVATDASPALSPAVEVAAGAPGERGGTEALPTPVSFETVWRDLHTLGVTRPVLHALAGQANSEIREVADNGVWLYSHGIGREYLVPRELLKQAWERLCQTGQLVPRDLRMSYGAVTLLAHLPYVEYTADPVTLYYPARVPHPLGTVQRREPSA
ncbi:MAG TPA: hypothetical protein VFB73_13315 [Chloroflexota bacterium]|nr:hypothetical protein [Chloroflexota bacterium]